MIDWERVADLRAEVGEEDFAEVVELFLEEVEEVVARLRAAPNPARFEDDLHFLKGSALNLGFRSFSGLCQTGEKQAATGQAAAVNIVQVLASYEASKQEFLNGLPQGTRAA